MDKMILWKEANGEITFAVKVVPRAKRTEVAGVEGDAVRIRLNAPPVEGRANEALIKFLAEIFGISKSSVEILSGETGRKKRVRLRGVRGEQMRKLVPQE